MRIHSWPFLLLLAAVVSCGRGEDNQPVTVKLADNSYDTRPQAPSILRDVALIDDNVEFTHPYVPGHRTSMDGRVAIRVQGGPPGTERINTSLSFFLFVPERLTEPLMDGPNGAEILAETTPFDVIFPPALDPEVSRLGHHTICDPTEEFAVAGERPNPYPCGADDLNDCYDLHVVSSTSPGATLWGTPVTVEVEQPKTPDARIVSAVLGEPVEGDFIAASTEFTEPAVTADGRLLTGRIGRFPREWTNPNTGVSMIRPYDLAYAVLPADSEPCDITGWTEFHPMSHAPYDPEMVGTYGLAAWPFRDTEGELIPDGEDMGGTYPWVDREGANIFMTGVHGRMSEQSEEKFPRRCVVEGCEAYPEQVDFDRGYMVAGLWTHGKLVHLDGMINSIDWAVGIHPDAHYDVDLYADADEQPVAVRFGSGRFLDHWRATEGPYPAGYTHNANILDSLQNVLNHKPEVQTLTPRDVVWVMSNGVATDEIAFDDLLDPNALIVSNMQPSITQIYDEFGSSTSIPWQHNGQVRDVLGVGILSIYALDPDADEEVHVQNGATSPNLNVPSYGLVEAGLGRTEPVALGGVNGRGFWLSGDAGVHYDMPANDGIDDRDSYVGMYVDPRAPDGESRTLLTFPDKTGVVLMGGSKLLYVRGDAVVHQVSLPDGDGWMHLAWRLRGGHRDATLLVNGFPLDRYRAAAPIFSFGKGDLVVGKSGKAWTGARAWIDDFHVLAHDVDAEVACNHASGTLVEVIDDATWSAVAGEYPQWAHDEVGEAVGASGAEFACVLDLTEDFGAHLANIPTGTRSLRTEFLFPEGPLRHGAPRPDSTQNAFCLTCHTDEGRGGLTVDALVYDANTVLEEDVRRQPSQPPRRVFGNVPGGWIPAGAGDGSPAAASVAPAEGFLIDQWVLEGG